MKKILVLIFGLTTLYSCSQNKFNKKELLKNYKIMNYEYKTDQRPSYGIEYNTTLKCELWINDVPLERNYNVSHKSNAEIINDLLLGNGKHTFTMKFFPNATSKEDSLITQEDMKWTKIKLVKAEVIPNSPYGETKNREELIDFKIPEITTPVPYFEFTGEFEVTDLPYELEGWKNSQDLSKVDREVLEKDVVAFYNYIRELLNNGEVEKTLLEDQQKNNEVAIATYDDPNWYLGEENINDILAYKNSMLPIENYKMEIFGEGRLVTLIRIDKEFFPWDVIIRETPSSWFYSGVVIHKPQGSDSFKIIRK